MRRVFVTAVYVRLAGAEEQQQATARGSKPKQPTACSLPSHLDFLRTLRLLRQELVAGEREDLEAALVQLRVQRLELAVPAHGLASEGGDVDDEADLTVELVDWELHTLRVVRFEVEEVGRKLVDLPVTRILCSAAYYLCGDRILQG